MSSSTKLLLKGLNFDIHKHAKFVFIIISTQNTYISIITFQTHFNTSYPFQHSQSMRPSEHSRIMSRARLFLEQLLRNLV